MEACNILSSIFLNMREIEGVRQWSYAAKLSDALNAEVRPAHGRMWLNWKPNPPTATLSGDFKGLDCR